MTPHPFVATPNNGPCSSCGRPRTHSIHQLLSAEYEKQKREVLRTQEKVRKAQESLKKAIEKVSTK